MIDTSYTCPKCGGHECYVLPSDNYRKRCAACQRERMRAFYKTEKYKEQNRIRHKTRRKRVPMDVFDAMVAKQEGKCLICGKTPKGDLRIDHDHTTGRLRNLLCAECNSGLGLFYENTDSLRKAIEYVENWRQLPLGGSDFDSVRLTAHPKESYA